MKLAHKSIREPTETHPTGGSKHADSQPTYSEHGCHSGYSHVLRFLMELAFWQSTFIEYG